MSRVSWRVQWSQAVWESDLSTRAKIVALCYADHMQPDARAWVTTERLAQRTSMSERNAIRGRGDLEDAGWLVLDVAATNRTAAVYLCLIPGVVLLGADLGCHPVTPNGPRGDTVSPQTDARGDTLSPLAVLGCHPVTPRGDTVSPNYVTNYVTTRSLTLRREVQDARDKPKGNTMVNRFPLPEGQENPLGRAAEPTPVELEAKRVIAASLRKARHSQDVTPQHKQAK